MAPPQYADLGKTAKDLFNKGYSKINDHDKILEKNLIHFFFLRLWLSKIRRQDTHTKRNRL